MAGLLHIFDIASAIALILGSLRSVSLDDQTWDLVPAIVGGVIGALAGGLPAYFLSVRASKETTTRDASARLYADLTLLYSMAQRLIEITNGLYTICLQFNEQLDAAACAGRRNWPIHAVLVPMLGLGGEDIRFTSEEIALLFRHDQSDIANELLLIARRYSANMLALAEYSTRREQMTQKLTPSVLKDGIGTVELQGKEALQVKAMMLALDQTAEHLLKSFNLDRRTAMRLSTEFGQVGKAIFPNSKVPSMEMYPE